MIPPSGYLRRVIMTFTIVAVPMMLVLLFTYDIIKINWASNMEDQIAIEYQQGPRKSAPADSVRFDGPSEPEGGLLQNPVPADAVSLERGRILFERNCMLCHGAAGLGDGPITEFWDYRVKCFDSSESFLSRFDPREVACLIADIRMEGMSGLELQDKLLERKSPLPVVFITGHGDVPMAVTTMKKGAMDFIEKPFKEEELLGLVERMLEEARAAFSQHQEAASRDALLGRLTTRESQVLERIVAGRLNKQIADDLGISIKTVEAHRANIMEKLNANTVADLLKIALGASGKS